MLLAAEASAYSMFAGCLVIALAIYAVYRQLEVRLVLLLASLALGMLAWRTDAIVTKFLQTLSDEKFVVPICTALGFAYVIRHTGCDQHLVRLLVNPLRKARVLLIPGTVVIGFVVNMPIISQTSTAVTIGPVVIPLLLAARLSPATVGAAVLLGSSVGGELFNPGAPELRTVITESKAAAKRLELPQIDYDTEHCIRRILPLNLLGAVVATAVFWVLALRRERASASVTLQPEASDLVPALRVNLFKALIPLIPLVLLYLTAAPLRLIPVPREWLVAETRMDAQGLFDSRLIGATMLIGAAVAGAVVWRKGTGVATAFFEGAGYGFANVVSLIVTASCFGEGIKQLGLAQVVGGLVGGDPALMLAAGGALALGFACLSGSGMATTQSLFVFFAEPSLRLGVDPLHTGAVVSIASAAGRTISPVSAVNLMSAKLTDTSPLELSRLVAVPLLASTAVMVLTAILLGAP